jgi:CRISPR-associated Csx2 family protein
VYFNVKGISIMSGYTLITSIGTGMYKKINKDKKDGSEEKEKYIDTVYQFPDGKKQPPTNIFLKAILEAEYWTPIKKVILVGTTSSSWDVLIPYKTDFWRKVLDECKMNAFSDESKNELELKLSELYNNIKFEIVVHTNEFTEENVLTVFNKYLDIPKLIEPETKILFDITHGFRSMPLLILQSLQVNASKIYGRKVVLIYGEFIDKEKISLVRDLSEYWEYYEISLAIKMFEDKLNGKVLAKKIERYWKKGSECLIKLSDIVECNFSLQICEVLKDIKDALKDYSEEGKLLWVNDVRERLDKIYKELQTYSHENYPIAKTVWKYSKLLRTKNLVTQAVIALQVVVETSIAEKYAKNDPSKIGDYSWYNGYFNKKKSIKVNGIGETKLNNICKKNKELGDTLDELEIQRNNIAHGGGKNKKGKYPNLTDVKLLLQKIDHYIMELFTILDKEK